MKMTVITNCTEEVTGSALNQREKDQCLQPMWRSNNQQKQLDDR